MKTTSSGTGEYAEFHDRDEVKPYNPRGWRFVTANIFVTVGLFACLVDFLMIGSPLAIYWGVGGAVVYLVLSVWETISRIRAGYQQ